MIGKTLGHYCVLEKIGEGGMGVVYRAHDQRLDRDVALKVLPQGALSDEAARKQFRKEALALSRLNHPNIATVFDFDTEDGTDFLVLEFIPGMNLEEKLAAGELPEKDFARLGMQLADGLTAAHQQGVVHRDLKPRNLRVTPEGRLKILDFGLAKLVHPVSDLAPTETLSDTTVAGTLPYMAPEQLLGETIDARTDIYGCGAVLYEMATGRRPFQETQRSRLMGAILHQAPMLPRQAGGRVSPEVEQIIAKCLEKEPEDRYQSARDLEVDLRHLATRGTTGWMRRPEAPRSPRRRWLLIGPAVVLLAALATLNLVRLRERNAANARIRSLAVLPLENLSHDPGQNYFVDGMTEALITEMSKVGALRVISRTSVMEYKGTHKSLPEIAQELHVDALVDGSVQQAGGRVRITAELIDARSRRNLWADSYDRDLRDILGLQRDVAQAVVREIKVTLTPQEQQGLSRAGEINPAVYESYLRGRFYLNQRTPEGLQKALAFFQQALEQDPNYALAYAGMADAYGLLPNYAAVAASAVMPKAKAAALRALQLDDTLAEAYTSQGLVAWSYDWDWAAAEKAYQRALALSPSYATAHHWYALELSSLGRNDEALEEISRAQQLDPLSPIISANLVWCLYLAHQYDQAIEQGRKVVELYPNFAVAHEYLGQAYAEKAMTADAIAEVQRSMELSPDNALTKAELAYSYALAGQRGKALAIVGQLKQQSLREPLPPYVIAMAYAGLGDNSAAIQWLEKSYQERDGRLVNLNVHPVFQHLRSDRRFQQLLLRTGLQQ